MSSHPHLTVPKLLAALAAAAAVLTGAVFTGSWPGAQQVFSGPVGVSWLLGSVPASIFVMLEVPSRWARWVDATVAVALPAALLASLPLWASLEPKSVEANVAMFNMAAAWAGLLYLTSPPHSQKQQQDAVAE